MKNVSIVAVSVLVLGLAAPVLAHHSFAMFDNESQISLEGAVVDFQWTNPHTWIQLSVRNDQGEMEEWSIEGSSRNALARRGWESTTFRPGDQVVMVINPLKSGATGGSFVSASFGDGRALNARQVPPPRETGARARADAAEGRAYPDWSGVWQNTTGIHFTNPAGTPNPPPLNAEYAARYEAVRESAARGAPLNDPTASCVWPGVPRIIVSPYPSEYVITPGLVYIIYEYMSQVRRIFTDGRPHPDGLEPSYNGHSIGHWEGDTLVVETVGLREDTMYENTGLPHSDQLVIRERIRLIEPDILENEVTAHDPKALTAPWTTKVHYARQPDWSIIDYVCAENNRNPIGPDGRTLTLGPEGLPLD